MDAKISVIIPVYNKEQYIRECLDSIINQTIKDIEIIAVNDGSTDGSLSILEEYANMHNNIVIFTQENQGAGAARNKGIRHARGKYLIFIDPDDYYPSNDCLEALYCGAEENNVLMCGGMITQNNKGVKTLSGKKELREYFRNRIVEVQDYPEVYGHTRYLYRADLIKENKIWYAAYRCYEDQIFVLNALVCAGKFYGLDKVIYEYRVGYKKVIYSLEMSIDVLRGIRDIFKVAKEYELLEMYKSRLKNIHRDYVIPFYKYSFCGNEKIDETIKEINEIVTEWIGGEENVILTKEKVEQVRKSSQRMYEFLMETLANEEQKIIYGAGLTAKKLIEQHQSNMRNVIGIAVTNKNENCNDLLMGLPVRQVEEYLPVKEKILVVIFTLNEYQEEIERNLKNLGFCNVLKLDMKKIDLVEIMNK